MSLISPVRSLLLAASLLFTAQGVDAQSPLSYDIRGRPATDVSVNGSGPVTFVIDTAAQTSAIGKWLIEDLGLEPDPEKTAQVHGAGGVAEVPLYPLKTLSIGRTTFNDLLVPTLPHSPDSDARGIIGMNLFAGKRVLFDRANAQFSVGESGSGPLADQMNILPADLIYGTFARIQITVDGVAVTAVVDTGAQRSIANRKLMTALNLTEKSPGLSTEVRKEGVTGHDTKLVKGYNGEIKLGHIGLATIPIEFADLPVFNSLKVSDGPALILGDDALSQLSAFALDYGAAEFQYTAVPAH